MTVWRKQALRSIKPRTPKALEYNSDHSMRRKCARCGRGFYPKSSDQRFGPKCEKKQKNNHIEVRDEKGQITAVIV